MPFHLALLHTTDMRACPCVLFPEEVSVAGGASCPIHRCVRSYELKNIMPTGKEQESYFFMSSAAFTRASARLFLSRGMCLSETAAKDERSTCSFAKRRASSLFLTLYSKFICRTTSF